MQINNIFIKPVLTEKATKYASQKVYMFEVGLNATKTQIAAAAEKLFKITVESVRVVRRIGKVRRTGKKMVPTKEAYKKIAYITAKEGKIDLFPQA